MIGQTAPSPEELEQTALEQRLAMEQSAGLVAVAVLIEALGLPPGSGLEEISAALSERDISADEAADWLKACSYDVGCFQREMQYQLAAGQRRKAGQTASIVAIGLALSGAVAAYYVYRKRH